MIQARDDGARRHEKWAHFRFQVVGRLLAAPPKARELAAALSELACRQWTHPITFQPFRLSFSTVERWYYQARRAPVDPVAPLFRRPRKDLGHRRALSPGLAAALVAQHQAHRTWSYRLHFDNLAALAKAAPSLGEVPSYASVLRFMKERGLYRQRRRDLSLPGVQRAIARLEAKETRSYEAAHVNGLWHLDFHHASRKVVTSRGELVTPLALGVLDDRSRLCCHLQWYLAEDAEALVHGLCQAFQKRALPRALMTDNGSAMLAGETRAGLFGLGIVHETTLPYSPHQNGKQEKFWGQLEGRLLPMLEGVSDLSLATLNESTQAFVEIEYNRKVHGETGQSPLSRYLDGPDLGRPSPGSEALRDAFRVQVRRSHRRSDGTFSLSGVRFEVPSRYRHFEHVSIRYASWDLSRLTMVDERTGMTLCRVYPLDKESNADGRRRTMDPVAPPAPPPASSSAPLLDRLLAEYAAAGLPPAYLPKEEPLEPPTPKGVP